MESMVAFADESGTSSLKDDSVFIPCVLTIPESQLQSLKKLHNIIVGKYFQGNPRGFQSKAIGSDDEKRIKILLEIAKYKKNNSIGFVAVAIDKASINADDTLFHNKSDLYKFSFRILYQKLVKYMHCKRIVAHRIGTENYMESFMVYLKQRKVISDNIEQQFLDFWEELPEFEFQTTEQCGLLSFPDFIAGCLNRLFNAEGSSIRETIIGILQDNHLIHALELYPRSLRERFSKWRVPLDTDNEEEIIIREWCYKQAVDYLNRKSQSVSEQTAEECQVLELMKQVFLLDPDKWTFAKEICDELDISENTLYRRIIPSLRDNDVLISSCNKGYKLPAGSQDILTFILSYWDEVKPMLQRIDKAISNIQIATHGKWNILGNAGLHDLANILTRMKIP